MTDVSSLSPAARAALGDLADALMPGGEGMPSASSVGTHQDLLDRVARALKADAEARHTLSQNEEIIRRHATLTPAHRNPTSIRTMSATNSTATSHNR